MSVDLPEPGRAHDRGEATLREANGYAIKCVDSSVTFAIATSQLDGRDDERSSQGGRPFAERSGEIASAQ